MTRDDVPLVVHVIYRLDVGGLENGLVNLINRTPVHRYRHAIVCLAGFSGFRSRLQRADVPVLSLDKRPGKDPAAYLRFWRLLRRLRPDVVHTRNIGTIDLQWVAVAAGIRGRVHGEHGWEAADPTGSHPRALRIRRACRPAIQRYVAVSQDIARWLTTTVGVPSSRVSQIYTGVDSSRFLPGETQAEDGGGAPAGSAGSVTFGTVGRLDPVKNQPLLLQAFRQVVDTVPGGRERLRLVIVGDGPMRASLQAATTELGISGCVHFAGMRTDIPEVLRGFDVFVLPSINEGISNTILEAMATGLPVIASRVGGNPEIVQDGVSGCLVPAGSAAELAAAMRRYAEDADLRRRQGSVARRRMSRDFGLDSMVEGYLGLYDSLLGRTRSMGDTLAGEAK